MESSETEMNKGPTEQAGSGQAEQPKTGNGSGPMGMNTEMLMALGVIVILLLSTLLFAFEVIELGDDDDDDDDDDGDVNGGNEPQMITNVSVAEARTLIQDNTDNVNFVILDVRTPGEVADGYIADSVNIDYFADGFEEHLDILDRDLTYLVYCKSGGRSGLVRDMMEAKDFKDVTNMEGGFMGWAAAEYDIAMIEQMMTNVTVAETLGLISNNTDNSEFVIIDVRTPEEHAAGYIPNSLNVDYFADTFTSHISALDRDITYLVHCKSGGRSWKAVQEMQGLRFTNIYHMLGGFNHWLDAGYGYNTVEPQLPAQMIVDLDVNETNSLIQNNTNVSTFVILDVRTWDERNDSGFLEDSLHFNFWDENFNATLDTLDKTNTYLVYCKSSGRSGMAVERMEDRGFLMVYDMDGGMNAWNAAGLPVDMY